MARKAIPSTLKTKREGDQFMVTVPNHWGKGVTLKEAKAQCRDAGGKIETYWRVYSVHPDTFMNEHGQLVYPKDHTPEMLAENNP